MYLRRCQSSKNMIGVTTLIYFLATYQLTPLTQATTKSNKPLVSSGTLFSLIISIEIVTIACVYENE